VDTSLKTGIIGAGIMGEALLVAISKGGITPSSISIADKRTDRLSELKSKYGCSTSNASDVAIKATNILLVIKPQDMDALLG